MKGSPWFTFHNARSGPPRSDLKSRRSGAKPGCSGRSGMMRAGADRRVITPSIERPVWLAGFQPNRPALGIQDNLYLRTLALQDGLGELLVLSACDLIGVLRGEVLAIRAAAGRQGIDERAVHVIATHTHHGPDTIGLWGPDPATTGRDPHYIDALCASAVDSICAAGGRPAPACILIAS